MKNSLLIVLVLAAAIPVRAQKVIEKHFDMSANGFVSMNFQISDSIKIVTWKKNEVYVKSTINVNDNKNNDDYKESFSGSGTSVDITGKLVTHCNNFHSRRKSSDSSRHSTSGDNDSDCCCNCGCETYITHEIYLPENTDFSVETINGNIVITGNTAEIRAHTISGYIDLTMAPEKAVALRMRTISGTLYSNFDLGADDRRGRRVGGGNLDAHLNGSGGKAIDLETISGDIYFRKGS